MRSRSRLGSVDEIGSQSIRRMLEIEPEDPAIFRPYTVPEAIDSARIISQDGSMPVEVRSMLSVGIAYDLMPAHLMPSVNELAVRLRTTSRRVRRIRLVWETLDPDLRFSIVRRACRMILAKRGGANY